MSIDLNIPATIAVVALLAAFFFCWLERGGWALLCGFVFFAAAMTYCETTPEAEAERKQKADAERQARIPHVIREADGCKVYAFVAGSKEHYFTRCADSVTTDRNYEVKKSCGKNCTKVEQHTETIVTTKEAP